jgi:hypothetical protein
MLGQEFAIADRCLVLRPRAQEDPMSRPVYSPSTLPFQPRPDPLLRFIQQAQIILLYRTPACVREAKGQGHARVAA